MTAILGGVEPVSRESTKERMQFRARMFYRAISILRHEVHISHVTQQS
jgi:hypothetical protein